MTKIMGSWDKEIELIIEVDGEELEFTGLLDDPILSGNGIGGDCGMDADVSSTAEVIGWTRTKMIWGLAVERDTKEGYWAINGLFKRGEWDKGENGEIIYRVWERIV